MSADLSSCPPLSETNIELIIQQLLIVCANINGDRQALQAMNKKMENFSNQMRKN